MPYEQIGYGTYSTTVRIGCVAIAEFYSSLLWRFSMMSSESESQNEDELSISHSNYSTKTEIWR